MATMRKLLAAFVLAATAAVAADRPENFVQWREGLASSAQPQAAWLATVGEQKYEVLVNLAPPLVKCDIYLPRVLGPKGHA